MNGLRPLKEDQFAVCTKWSYGRYAFYFHPGLKIEGDARRIGAENGGAHEHRLLSTADTM